MGVGLLHRFVRPPKARHPISRLEPIDRGTRRRSCIVLYSVCVEREWPGRNNSENILDDSNTMRKILNGDAQSLAAVELAGDGRLGDNEKGDENATSRNACYHHQFARDARTQNKERGRAGRPRE